MFPEKPVVDIMKSRYWLVRRLDRALTQSLNNYDYPLLSHELLQVASLYTRHFIYDLAACVYCLYNHEDADAAQISRCLDRLYEIADEVDRLYAKASMWDPQTTYEREAATLYLVSQLLIQLGRLEDTINDFKIFESLQHAPDLLLPPSLHP